MTNESHPFVLALVQMSSADDPDVNVEAALDLCRDAIQRGADVVCLPELFRSRYFCQTEEHTVFDLAEPIPSPTTARFSALAREAGIVIGLPVFERRASGVYHNSFVILDTDGTHAGLYRKMHIPDDPRFYEKFYFTPGDLGFQTIHTRKASLGPLICWDQWYPEAARLTALAGASTLLYPTAIGWLPEEKAEAGEIQRDAWITVQRGHAIANNVYVATVNRIGFEAIPGMLETGIEFWGSSFICDPQGQILAQASSVNEEILLAEIDPARIEAKRREWPFLRDRRIDAYGGMTQRFLDG